MFPTRSTARLGRNRYITLLPSGSQVVACKSGVAMVPPVTLAWYQRGAAEPLVSCRRTVCAVQRDSTPPIFVYWFCIIARVGSTSRLLPLSDGAFGACEFGQLVEVVGVNGPVNVESEMSFQSTWNL